jgi:hypothetical protein
MLAMVAVAACVLCVPVVAHAQGTAATPTAATPTATKSTTKNHAKAAATEERNELNEHVQMMTERLKLTDDQVAKVREILQSKSTQMSELRAKYKGQLATPENRASIAKAHEELHADIEAKLAQVLTTDQMTEYKKMAAEHMKKESEKDAKAENEGATKGTQK